MLDTSKKSLCVWAILGFPFGSDNFFANREKIHEANAISSNQEAFGQLYVDFPRALSCFYFQWYANDTLIISADF